MARGHSISAVAVYASPVSRDGLYCTCKKTSQAKRRCCTRSRWADGACSSDSLQARPVHIILTAIAPTALVQHRRFDVGHSQRQPRRAAFPHPTQCCLGANGSADTAHTAAAGPRHMGREALSNTHPRPIPTPPLPPTPGLVCVFALPPAFATTRSSSCCAAWMPLPGKVNAQHCQKGGSCTRMPAHPCRLPRPKRRRGQHHLRPRPTRRAALWGAR